MNPFGRESDETAMLRGLVAQMMATRPGRIALSGFSRRQLAAISATYFLLDGQPRHNTERFVTYTLGQLIEQLGRETERPCTTYIGQVRGQVNWPATQKARYTGDYHPARFVCREVRRDYDTAQNQLLRYVVERIGRCLAVVPVTIRQGFCYFPTQEEGTAPANSVFGQPQNTAARLDRMESALNRARLHAGFQSITLPAAITADHLRAAALSREESFGEAIHALERDAALHRPTERAAALAAAGFWALPLPGQSHGAGAIWIKLAVAILRGELVEED